MYEKLEGKTIVLRKARAEDSASMLENVWSDENVYGRMLFKPTFTADEAIGRCRRSEEFQKDHLAYFVALRENDEAIGFCGISETSPGHYEECGICIGTKYQGKGIGKEILSLLLDLAFDKLGAEDFRYGYFQDNGRSKRLAAGFGFRYEKTGETVREWDNAVKTIDYCLLSRDEYYAWLMRRSDDNSICE